MARTSIWKGSISFGLLNIPVTLQKADEEKNLHFSMLDEKDFSPIKYKKINANTGKEVPYSQIVKGFEYESGEYVILNDADFKAANPKATQAIDIEDFIPLAEIDPMLFEKPYYLAPQKTGAKGYFLLRDALKSTKKIAIGKIVIRTKQHLVAVMPKEDYLILEILRFPHEVRAVNQVNYLDEVSEGKKSNYNDRELKMAQELINGMTDHWRPNRYKDTYYDDLMKRIQQKVKSGKGHTVSRAEPEAEEVKPTKVVDLLPLLRKSLEQTGKTRGRAAGSHAKKSSRKSRSKHETAS